MTVADWRYNFRLLDFFFQRNIIFIDIHEEQLIMGNDKVKFVESTPRRLTKNKLIICRKIKLTMVNVSAEY